MLSSVLLLLDPNNLYCCTLIEVGEPVRCAGVNRKVSSRATSPFLHRTAPACCVGTGPAMPSCVLSGTMCGGASSQESGLRLDHSTSAFCIVRSLREGMQGSARTCCAHSRSTSLSFSFSLCSSYRVRFCPLPSFSVRQRTHRFGQPCARSGGFWGTHRWHRQHQYSVEDLSQTFQIFSET